MSIRFKNISVSFDCVDNRCLINDIFNFTLRDYQEGLLDLEGQNRREVIRYLTECAVSDVYLYLDENPMPEPLTRMFLEWAEKELLELFELEIEEPVCTTTT